MLPIDRANLRDVFFALVIALALALLARLAHADSSTCPIPPSAIYVNCSSGPNGNGTAASPFNSLGAAQQSMRASHGGTAVVSGTCQGGLDLTAADSAETWEAAAGGASITGSPLSISGAQHISIYGFAFSGIPSGSQGGMINLDNPSDVTLRWNSFTNCQNTCVGGSANGLLIDSNTFNGMAGNQEGTPMGAVTIKSSLTFTHNLVENSQGSGLRLVTTDGGISNSLIGSNILENIDTVRHDTGAIYLRDTTASATGIQITDNAVLGDGPAANKTKCIYLDDGTSNVAVTQNICAASGGDSAGSFGVFIHAGVNNIVAGNTLEIANGTYAAGYQTRSGANTRLTDMSGNQFKNNTVYTPDGATPGNLVWVAGTSMDPGPPPNALAVQDTHYLSSNGVNVSSLLTDQGPLPSACYSTPPTAPIPPGAPNPPNPLGPTPCFPAGMPGLGACTPVPGFLDKTTGCLDPNAIEQLVQANISNKSCLTK
jgi:hypothetical protein